MGPRCAGAEEDRTTRSLLLRAAAPHPSRRAPAFSVRWTPTATSPAEALALRTKARTLLRDHSPASAQASATRAACRTTGPWCAGGPTCSAHLRPRLVSATSRQRGRQSRPSRTPTTHSRPWRWRTTTLARWPRTERPIAGAKTGMDRPPHQQMNASLPSRPASRIRAACGNRTGQPCVGGPTGETRRMDGSSRSVPDGATRARSEWTGRQHAGAATIGGPRLRRRASASRPSEAAISTAADSARTARSSAGAARPCTAQSGTLKATVHDNKHRSEDACGVRPDGSAVCWGGWPTERYPPPAGEMFSTVSSDSGHACGLRTDGAVVCWGVDHDGQTASPWGADAVFSAVAVGSRHSCAIRTDGEIVCWGSNFHGESSPPGGERYTEGPTVPVAGRLTDVSTGAYHGCGLRLDGTAVCWGPDRHGEASPPAGETFVSISSGVAHTCALRSDGTPVCWGRNDHGESSPPEGVSLQALSSGARHSCGLSIDGTAVCWGSGEYGQLSAPAGETFVSISSGTWHTCGLRLPDMAPICWGSDHGGQSSPPEQMGLLSIGCGLGSTCAVTPEGALLCWGGGQHQSHRSLIRARVHSGEQRRRVRLRADQRGKIACWGSDYYGQASPPRRAYSRPSTVGSSARAHSHRTGLLSAGVILRGRT